MADRDRVLAYVATLIALFVFAYVAGWWARPWLGYDDHPAQPTPPPAHSGTSHDSGR